MFYGHAMFIGGNSHKGSRYLSFPPGLSLSRPVDTKTHFNLNNIIATLPLISISSVKKFAGIVLQLDLNSAECQSWWVSTLRVTRPWRHNLCALPLVRCKTIDPFPLRHRNIRNLTLQQECYLTNTRAFFRLRTALLDIAFAKCQRATIQNKY